MNYTRVFLLLHASNLQSHLHIYCIKWLRQLVLGPRNVDMFNNCLNHCKLLGKFAAYFAVLFIRLFTNSSNYTIQISDIEQKGNMHTITYAKCFHVSKTFYCVKIWMKKYACLSNV